MEAVHFVLKEYKEGNPLSPSSQGLNNHFFPVMDILIKEDCLHSE